MDRRDFLKLASLPLAIPFVPQPKGTDIQVEASATIPPVQRYVRLNGRDLAFLEASLSYNCVPIQDWEESLRVGWVVSNPGPVERRVYITSPEFDLGLKFAERAMLEIPHVWTGSAEYVGWFKQEPYDSHVLHEFRV